MARAFRSIRKASGKSVQEVANYLGISRQAANDYELGKSEPNLTTLQKLAKLYGCTIEELLAEDDSKEVGA